MIAATNGQHIAVTAVTIVTNARWRAMAQRANGTTTLSNLSSS